MLKVIAGIKSAARHERVCGADCSGVSKSNLYVIIIILRGERIFKDAENVTAVVIPIFGYEFRCNLLQLIGKTLFTGHTETALQCCGNGVVILVFVFPKIKTAGILPAARIGNVKNISEPWIISGGVKERDTLGAAADISAHLLIPKVIIGTGGCVRLLSENHQLLMERIFVQPSHCFKKRCPLPEAACNLPCGAVSHLRIKLQFAWQ